jgi:hypothetical protein
MATRTVARNRREQRGQRFPASGTGAIVSESRRLAAAPVAAEAAVEGERKVERKPVMPFTITRVQPVGTRKINMMVYGPYGAGKTFFAGTSLDVPSMRDVLFINAEAGDMSLTDRRDLDIININKYDTLARIFEYLTLHCKWRDEGNTEKLLEYERQLKSEIIPLDEQTEPVDPNRTWFEEQRLRTGKPMDEPYRYRTVIIDSLSEAHKYLVYKFTGVDIGKTALSDEIERMEEWQPAQELFRLLIRSFRDLPMNTIFVSAESIEPERKNKVRNPRAGQALPKLAGQMAGDVAGFIDIVGYLYREVGKDGENNRYLYLGAGYEGWISKHRFVNLPDLEYVENPSLSSLIELARKDAEAHGTSQARAAAGGNIVPSSHHAASSAAPQRSRSASAASNSHSSGGARGRRAGTVRRVR